MNLNYVIITHKTCNCNKAVQVGITVGGIERIILVFQSSITPPTDSMVRSSMIR